MTRQTFEIEVDDGWLRTRLVATGYEDLRRLDGASLGRQVEDVINRYSLLHVVRCEHVAQASDLDSRRPRPDPLPGYEHLVGRGT